jgi:beta-xylosidase
MRTVLIHRADSIIGPWEGRVALQDQGVAQGSVIDTPEGKWFAYLFRDSGAVGRIPYLVPVEWKDGWPVLGVDGKVPEALELPAGRGLMPGVVASDHFDRRSGEPALPLVWQWNHKPDNKLWSVTARPGFLRLTTGTVESDFLQTRNTLTQRTFGPESAASTSIDVRGMQDGDFAGLALLQKNYGMVGVKAEGAAKNIVMVSAVSGAMFHRPEPSLIVECGRLYVPMPYRPYLGRRTLDPDKGIIGGCPLTGINANNLAEVRVELLSLRAIRFVEAIAKCHVEHVVPPERQPGAEV